MRRYLKVVFAISLIAVLGSVLIAEVPDCEQLVEDCIQDAIDDYNTCLWTAVDSYVNDPYEDHQCARAQENLSLEPHEQEQEITTSCDSVWIDRLQSSNCLSDYNSAVTTCYFDACLE